MPVERTFSVTINPFNAATMYFMPAGSTVSANEPGLRTEVQVGGEWVRYRWVRFRCQAGTAAVQTGQRVVFPQFSEDDTGDNFREGARGILSTSDQQIFLRNLVAGKRVRWVLYHLGANEGSIAVSGRILFE
ncbi:MAG TPA: hypothetical protein VKF62_00565 [Planctomycetota bacterium]|nr:hypothetical protein [Planctomycetota bacterium]